MSAILGANTAHPAGTVTYLPEGEGERSFDALLADVIPKGLIVWHDYANATPALRGYKLPGTAGAERGPYKLVTKDKAAGKAKVVGIGHGAEGTAIAGATIVGGSKVKLSAVTAGRVDQMALLDEARLQVGEYVRMAKYANSGDGNNAIPTANAGDVIVIKLL
jgi:hypothetical protein